MAPGGKGANQAIAAKKSGADVTFITRVGNDDFGRRSVENYQREGLETAYIIRDMKDPSGIAFITVDGNGENSIAVASGANSNLLPADIERNTMVISQSDIILLQLEVPLQTVFTAAKTAFDAGKTIILNPAPARKLADDLLSIVTIITPNENEAEILTGIKVTDEKTAKKAADMLLAKGVQTVILTMGSKGLLFVDKNRTEFVPAYKVEAVDTTAAGDVFNGAFAAALSENMELLSSIRFASAAAGISVTRMGAQTSIPGRNEVEQFLKSKSLVA